MNVLCRFEAENRFDCLDRKRRDVSFPINIRLQGMRNHVNFVRKMSVFVINNRDNILWLWFFVVHIR